MIWSSHQGSRKKRRSSSACGRRSYRIFCRRCGSWCDAYRKIGYPWSINDNRGRILVMVNSNNAKADRRKYCQFPTKQLVTVWFPTDQLSPIIFQLQPARSMENHQLRREVSGWIIPKTILCCKTSKYLIPTLTISLNLPFLERLDDKL